MPADAECECDIVSKEWLLTKLRSNENDAMVIDCRGSNEYAASHIRSAVNFSIPSIMLRRLAAGKIDLASTVQCKDLKARITSCRARGIFVLYSDSPIARDADSVHGILLKRLKQDGVRVVCLEGDFADFRHAYPEWCSEVGPQHSLPHLPLMGLRSLRISSSGYSGDERGLSSGSSSECEESHHHHLQDFPVEILPNLFLGNSSNSEDCDALARHNIKYVLNVTPDLPNAFETEGGINYLKIPIADHWSQNLAVYFPEAIRFIEEGVSSNCGVLVHCVAGISRSVTVTVAYLMQRHRLSLNDAFALVRSRKTDVAPNFHFMRQLHSFERDLGLHEESRSLSKVLEEMGMSGQRPRDSPASRGPPDSGFHGDASGAGRCACARPPGVSPDSGIEFDRWACARDAHQ